VVRGFGGNVQWEGHAKVTGEGKHKKASEENFCRNIRNVKVELQNRGAGRYSSMSCRKLGLTRHNLRTLGGNGKLKGEERSRTRGKCKVKCMIWEQKKNRDGVRAEEG